MTEQCGAYAGCDDRDCPMASWCVLEDDHTGDHTFETTRQRSARLAASETPDPCADLGAMSGD